jgi:hypothetical protein
MIAAADARTATPPLTPDAEAHEEGTPCQRLTPSRGHGRSRIGWPERSEVPGIMAWPASTARVG